MSDDFDLSKKLDVLIRLKALELCAGKTQVEKIEILDMAGLQPKEIAEILRTTSNTVSVRLSEIRRDRKTSGGQNRVAKAKIEEKGDDRQ